jgi:hypothetical protein
VSAPDDKKPPSESGSVDIAFSATKLDPVPQAVPPDDSQPVTSGRVAAPMASSESGSAQSQSPGRSRRITQAVQGAVSGGVEKFGAGVEKLGEGVTRLGDAIPLVGAGVSRLGEGISKAGESIHVLPAVAQTRRGRLMVRSVVVGFVLVFAWIAAIVAWQVRGNVPPDLRPDVERILLEISKGSASIDAVYQHASPRLSEILREEKFLDEMTDLNSTLGKFLELTAIHDTVMSKGPTGRIARVSLTASYEKGLCSGDMTFHWDAGKWKLLGIYIELPPDLKITKEMRVGRVKLCDDPMNPRTCEIYRVADKILHDVHEGRAATVWDEADDLFKNLETRDKFIELQQEQSMLLGSYIRIITVTEAKSFDATYTTAAGGSNDLRPHMRYTATYDVLAQFDKASGVRVVFGFSRADKTSPWRLDSFKVVLPMPRADEEPHPGLPLPALPGAGSGSASAP